MESRNSRPAILGRVPIPVWITLATLALHSLIAWLFPTPVAFRKYALAAEQILSGQLPAERLMDFSPLYLQISILCERLFSQPELALTWIQIFLVALSNGLLYALFRQRFSAALAALAVGVLAFDRHVLIYEQVLEPEAWVLFFLIAILFFLGRDRPLLAGLAAALSLATRPNLLPVFALVPLDMYFRGLRHRPLLRSTLAFGLPIALMFGLLMVRAHRITGDATTPVMNPGTVFFEGNNPLSRGTSAVYPPAVLTYVHHGAEIPDSAHHFYRVVARAETGEDLSIAEVNAFWSGKAMAFIRDEPLRFSRLLLDKLVNAFHSFRWHDVPSAWRHDLRLYVPTVPLALVSALALLGLLLESSRWRDSLLFYALILAQLGVMLVFYVSARQRVPLLPALLYFALIAIEAIRREKSGRILALVLVGTVTLALMLPSDLTRDESYREQGLIATDQILGLFRDPAQPQPLAQNADLVLEALANSPWWLEWIRPAGLPQDDRPLEQQLADVLEDRNGGSAPERFDRALIQSQAGRDTEATQELESLRQEGTLFYRKAFSPSDPALLLGRLAAQRGEPAAAQNYFEGVLTRSPGDPFALAELAALNDDEASRARLERYFSTLDAHLLIGRAMLLHGRPAEAEAEFRAVVERLPDFREGYLMLAVAVGSSGRLDEAVRIYRDGIRFGVEPVQFSTATVEIFRRWAQAYAEEPRAQLFTAQVLHQHGRLREAAARLEAIENPPDDLRGAIASELERLRLAMSPSP